MKDENRKIKSIIIFPHLSLWYLNIKKITFLDMILSFL